MAKAYLFTGKKHSVSGIMATVYGMISLGTFLLCILTSYESAGKEVYGLGASAILGIVFMIVGTVLCIRAFMESNRFVLFKVTGIIVNVMSFICLSIILYAAAML